MARRFLSFFLVLGIKSNIKQLKGTLLKDKALKVGQKAPRHFIPSRARAYLKESTTHRDQTEETIYVYLSFILFSDVLLNKQ